MKKKVVAAIMSVALVAAVGIGGTLAYLSAQSEVVNNTFTVGTGYTTDDEGHKGIWIDEEDIDNSTPEDIYGLNRDTENVYEDMVPGKTYTKDPMVYMIGGSIPSYVFVRVDGLSELAEQHIHVLHQSGKDSMSEGVNPYQYKLIQADGTDGDGIYLYVGEQYHDDSSLPDYVVDVSNRNVGPYSLAKVFNQVKMDSDVTTDQFENISLDADAITVQAAAVQYSPDEMDSFIDAGASLPEAWGATPNTWTK